MFVAEVAYFPIRVMRKMLQVIEEGSVIDYAKSIDVLVALHMLKQAWLLVSPATIRNCFRKAGSLTVGSDNNKEHVMLILAVAAELVEAVTQENFEAFVRYACKAYIFLNFSVHGINL